MRLRYLLLGIIAIFFILGFFTIDNWDRRLNAGDSNGYYLHVVSFFINQDVGDYNQTINSLLETNPGLYDPRKDEFLIRKTEKGRNYIKYSLGVSLMEVPAFLIAHAWAKMDESYKADGWSKPYMLSVNFSILVYVLLGFFFLIKTLELYFTKKIIALSILSIALATNLFYQATYTTMSHGFLFFDYCLLIYLSIHFYKAPSVKKALGLGALIGLITITRIPEVISALIPLLWGVYNWDTIKSRALFLITNKRYLLCAGVGFLIVFSPQFIYWYYVSGHLVFNPYQGQGFNFLDPNIYNGWFNFRNGWLVYTPIMAFSLLGWFFLRKKLPESQLAVFAFVGLNVWIHYSYYEWNYYPGLGSRPMVECYPLLIFGLAALYSFLLKTKYLKWVPFLIFTVFTCLNLFQTWQTKEGIIWTERSNKAFFWESFGKSSHSIQALRAFDSWEFQPDSSEINFIKTLHFDDFEDSTRVGISNKIVFDGQYALFDSTEIPNCKFDKSFSELSILPKDWIYVGTKAYRRGEDMEWNRDMLEYILVELFDENGKRQKWTHIKIACQIGNEEASIWHSGSVNQWAESGFFLRIPEKSGELWKLSVSVRNPGFNKLFMDDFHIEQYRDK